MLYCTMHFERLQKDIDALIFKGLFPVRSFCKKSRCAGTSRGSFPYYYIVVTYTYKFIMSSAEVFT